MTLANIITSFRIIAAIGLLFCPIWGVWFWTLYLIGGISDMIDGPIARWTHTESKQGAVLDSTADLIFVLVCLLKILPAIEIPSWLWLWIIIIAVIKIGNIVYVTHEIGKPALPHTIANKITGLLCFFLPFAINFCAFTIMAIIVCGVATFAAIDESRIIMNLEKRN